MAREGRQRAVPRTVCKSEDAMAKGKSTQKKETKKPKKDKSADATKDGKKK